MRDETVVSARRVTAPSAQDAVPRFDVRMFGTFAVSCDGVPLEVDAWPSRGRSLFRLLATASDRRRMRDEVIEALWPEATPEGGFANLRTVLHRVRRTIDPRLPAPILLAPGWIMLNPGCRWEIDLDRFEELAERAGDDPELLRKAAELGAGEVLAEDRYEDWASAVRERVSRERRGICLHLARLHRVWGSREEAMGWFERVLDRDPLDEEAVQGLLGALGEAGLGSEAVRRYQQFSQRLEVELDVSPAAETIALVARLRGQFAQRNGEPAGSAPTGTYLGAVPPGPLVAREEELERLQFAFDTVEGGAGQLVLLSGEPGIGKTRLAQEVGLQARNRGFVVATGCCYERCRCLPLYPFTETLWQVYEAAPPALRSEVASHRPFLRYLLPEQLGPSTDGLPTSAEEQHGLARAVTDFLVALSDMVPVALLLDDLHWADQMSLDLLQHLAHHTRAHRVLLLGTYRDVDLEREHPVRRAVQDVTREHLVERIPLGRLTVDGTTGLVVAGVGETEGVSEFAEFVHRRTKGIPFYIETMLQALGGRYQLVREIGAGGMGRVFEAVDTRTGERVAAKIMFSRSDADLHALRRFEQEGAVLASLEHEHIVQVKGTFIEEHASCIIMELLEGQSLGQLMQADELSLARIKQLAVQVAAALAYAHERHIVHRDIKPDNVMVVADDQAKVTDFGVARLLRPAMTLASLTSTGLTLGTPLYMAPDQIEGKKVDGRADLYSLGAMLYHLVAGRPPFEGEDPLTIAFKHVHQAPEPLRDVNPAVPGDWEAVILKALAKDPAERFQSAQAMQKAIAGLSEEECPADMVHVSSSEQRLVSPCEPSPKQAAGLDGEAERDRSAAAPPQERVKQGRTRRWMKLPPLLAGGSLGAVVLSLSALLIFHLLPTSSRAAGPVRLTARQPIAIFGTSPLRPADRLQSPNSLAVDQRGDLYVADVGHSRIEVLSRQGKVVTEWGTQGPARGQFENPVGVAVDQKGGVYVSDLGNETVQKFSATGKLLAGHGRIYSQNPPPPGALQSYVFSQPQGIGVDAHGRVFVMDSEDQCLVAFSSTLKLRGCWGTAGNGLNEWADPHGLAVDGTGHAYVADSGNARVVKLSPLETYWSPGLFLQTAPILPSFRFLHSWGTSGAGLGRFVFPAGVAVDRHGNIFVVDSYTCRVQELSLTGKLLAAWGRQGSRPGEFRNPQGLAVDTRNNVYVADSGNNRIQEFASTG